MPGRIRAEAPQRRWSAGAPRRSGRRPRVVSRRPTRALRRRQTEQDGKDRATRAWPLRRWSPVRARGRGRHRGRARCAGRGRAGRRGRRGGVPRAHGGATAKARFIDHAVNSSSLDRMVNIPGSPPGLHGRGSGRSRSPSGAGRDRRPPRRAPPSASGLSGSPFVTDPVDRA